MLTVKRSVSVPVIGSLNGVSEGGWTRHARLIEQAGANALELNIYFLAENQSDIDTENLEILSKLKLSTRDELLLRLRWLAMISGSLRLSLGITGGVHIGIDVVKAIMCGAHGVQMVSALLLNRPEYLTIVKNELSEWLESHQYESLEQMRGSMGKEHAPDRDLLEHVNYIRVLQGGVG
jgi:dihydroorotate dehydrogenase (fumarate)